MCSVVKEKNKVKEHVQNAQTISSKTVSKRQGAVMEKMDRSLQLCTDNQHHKKSGKPLNNLAKPCVIHSK